MTWLPKAVVTIGASTYQDDALAGLTINYGRTNVWEQARSGYATINILNTANTNNTYEVNDTVTVTIEDSSGNDVTIFTGKLREITAQMVAVGNSSKVAVETLVAVSVLSEMARVVVGTSTYAKEYEGARISAILTQAGVAVDVVDSGVYELTARAVSPTDAYSLAASYAQMCFGYIYETTSGEVGYANESRRTLEAQTNGYLTIDEDAILWQGISSNRSFNDITNDVLLSYKNQQTVTSSSAASIATYGTLSASIATELEQGAEAQLNADRYVTLRAYPQTSVSSFVVPIDSDNLTNALRDDLISIYMGLPIQVFNLPVPISHVTYQAFVEGWSWNIKDKQAFLTIISTDSTLSLAPTRWQDVSATLQWQNVSPTLQWFAYE